MCTDSRRAAKSAGIGNRALCMTALVVALMGGVARGQDTPTDTPTNTPTNTPTLTPTRTLTNTPTTTLTNTPRSTWTSVATATVTNTVRPTRTATPTPPTADTCGAVTVTPGTTMVDTAYANTETTAAPTCGNQSNRYGVWFSYTPLSGVNLVQIDTLGSNYDTILAVFTGSCVSPSQVACNDDAIPAVQSKLQLPVTAGTTYYILVTAYGRSGGSLKLNITDVSPPATATATLTRTATSTFTATITRTPVNTVTGTIPSTSTPTNTPTVTNTPTSTPTVANGNVGAFLFSGTGQTPVVGAKVVFIKATDVTATADTVREPLAALAPTPGRPSGTTDASGRVSIPAPAGTDEYYVYVVPAATPTPNGPGYMPGGSLSRAAMTLPAGTFLSIEMSWHADQNASYIGGNSCRQSGCHSGPSMATSLSTTLHTLALRKPGSVGNFQLLTTGTSTTSTKYPNNNRALPYFQDGNPNDNTNNGTNDIYGYILSSTITGAGYDMWLGIDPNHSNDYFVQLAPAGTPGTTPPTSQKYYVKLTYGGEGIFAQMFLTTIDQNGDYADVTNGNPRTWVFLPLQFNEQAQEKLGVSPWTAYTPTDWSTGAHGFVLGTSNANVLDHSFDTQCAGCHILGATVSVDTNGMPHANAPINDNTNQFIDFDGDGAKDEIMVGCEGCHGPASEHAVLPTPGVFVCKADPTRLCTTNSDCVSPDTCNTNDTNVGTNVRQAKGVNIVNPDHLSAEALDGLCAKCHSAGDGMGTLNGHPTGFPSQGTATNGSGTVTVPRAGVVGVGELFTAWLNENPDEWGDADASARGGHQQYQDSIRASKFRNEHELIDCVECHSPHSNRDGFQANNSRGYVKDDSLCTNCHGPFGFGGSFNPAAASLNYTNDAVTDHMLLETGMSLPTDPTNSQYIIDFAKLGLAMTPAAGTATTPVFGPTQPYPPGTFIPGPGNCVGCHMPRTARTVNNPPYIREGSHGTGANIMGTVASHTFKPILPGENVAGEPNSCGFCHNDRVVLPDFVQ